jgi:hypothetical protein
MEDLVLQNMWKEYDRKLEHSKVLNLQSWALNRQSFEMLQTQKAKERINKLIIPKAITIALGLFWVYLLGNLAYYAFWPTKVFLLVSAVAIMAVTIIAIATYIKQLYLIQQIDNSSTVIEAQRSLASLQASSINVVRVSFLQLPVWTIFYINPTMLHQANVGWWLIQVAVTGLSIWGTVWLYQNINIRNMHKKWFRALFNSISWNYIIKAMDFMEEIEQFKGE